MNEDKMENMLSQLIRMVGNIQSDLQEIKQEQQEMKRDEQQEMKRVQQDMQSKLQELEAKGEERHQEVLDRFKAIEIDQNFVWEKTVRNEREIATIKGQLS